MEQSGASEAGREATESLAHPLVKSTERGTSSTEAAGTSSRPVGVVAPQKRAAPEGPPPATRAPEPPSTAGAAPGPSNLVSPPPRNPTVNLEKRKLIQQQLLLFLHAHNCQRRENQANGEPCTLLHCDTMKSWLRHMSTCNAGRSCTVQYCSSSRQIIDHWRRCVRADCPVCLPCKQAFSLSNAAVAVAGPVVATLSGNVAAAVSQSVQQQQRGTNEWQQTVTLELRNHIVNKLVHYIFLNPSRETLCDRRMHNLVSYARNVESDMYEMANSMSEYYLLIAAKIVKIQKELEEKRHLRNQQRMQDAIATSMKVGKIGKPIGAVRPTRRHFHPSAASITASERMQQLHRLPSSIRRDALGVLLGRATVVQARRESAPVVSRTATPARPAPGPSSVPSEPNPVPSNDAVQASTSTSDATVSTPAEAARSISIHRCMETLVHACQCKDASCQLDRCSRMKRVVQHIKSCKRRTSGGCSICKQLVALCCHHARLCRLDKCPVPFCFNIKQKLKQQRERQTLRVKLFRPKASTFKKLGRR